MKHKATVVKVTWRKWKFNTLKAPEWLPALHVIFFGGMELITPHVFTSQLITTIFPTQGELRCFKLRHIPTDHHFHNLPWLMVCKQTLGTSLKKKDQRIIEDGEWIKQVQFQHKPKTASVAWGKLSCCDWWPSWLLGKNYLYDPLDRHSILRPTFVLFYGKCRYIIAN